MWSQPSHLNQSRGARHHARHSSSRADHDAGDASDQSRAYLARSPRRRSNDRIRHWSSPRERGALPVERRHVAPVSVHTRLPLESWRRLSARVAGGMRTPSARRWHSSRWPPRRQRTLTASPVNRAECDPAAQVLRDEHSPSRQLGDVLESLRHRRPLVIARRNDDDHHVALAAVASRPRSITHWQPPIALRSSGDRFADVFRLISPGARRRALRIVRGRPLVVAGQGRGCLLCVALCRGRSAATH